MPFHVFCTAANSTEFVLYAKQEHQRDINVAIDSVVIHGGSGVANKKLVTPLGVHTSVPESKMEWLKEDPQFKAMVNAGYISVSDRHVNPEVAAADMVTHDQHTDACPIVPQDFSEKSNREGLTAIKPILNKAA